MSLPLEALHRRGTHARNPEFYHPPVCGKTGTRITYGAALYWSIFSEEARFR